MRVPTLSRAASPRHAYVHLPFCRRRCHYCDFPVVVVGDKVGAADAAAERYVALLEREISASPRPAADAPPLRTVYFGGGTPSLTPPHLLGGIVRTLAQRQGISDDCEVTLEMDPGTFDAARLDAFIEAGVTRVSLGVQSFDDELLAACGRPHTVADTKSALSLLLSDARPALRSVSIDLIGGLPHQGHDSWAASLAAAAASGAQHVSVYDLQIEPRTAFGRWFSEGEGPLPAEEDAAQMFRDASASLRGDGFEHYEVSSYARPGHRSAHNGAYWRNRPFWGFGLGAASHLQGVRLSRPRRMAEYGTFVAELESTGWDVARAQGALEEGTDALTTLLMLQLRTKEGVGLGAIADAFTPSHATAVAAACRDASAELPAEWLEADLNDEGRGWKFALSDPEGMLFSNSAISTVFARLDERLEEL